MRISLNWLKQYIDIQISTEELSQRLTMSGFEVERVEHLGDKYRGFVVGNVVEVSKHPKADKLVVCKVDVGSEILQIVCGAPNVAAGQKVPVGLIGAEIPRNQHEVDAKSFRLSDIKIRGVESYGMICSEYELDLGGDKEGIMVLKPEAEPGTPLSEYFNLNDIVFEVGITPNRPDAMNHIGIAREVGAFLDKAIRVPSVLLKESKRNINDFVAIKIEDTKNCPRYIARVIFDVKVGPSPEWLQKRLEAVGIRPINNIVDVTNYVLMECGHPLHAFDYDKISDHTIVVREAMSGESYTTLDHKVRTLHADTLMICDIEKPIAIAGIMGGEDSEISNSTTNILIESAYFNPQSIRKTAKNFCLGTEASQRFERGADPNITRWAIDRASQLIQEICGGEVLNGVIDWYPNRILEKEVELRVDKTNDILGLTLSAKEISFLLKKFQIELGGDTNKPIYRNNLRFRVPTFRPDIEREIDLIEEVARGYGYDNIDVKTTASINFSKNIITIDFVDELRQCAIGSGFMEVITNSMQDISIAAIASDKVVKIANPISKDMEGLRTSLIPSLLDIVRHNIDRGIKDLRLFEIGKVYFYDKTAGKANLIPHFLEEDKIIFMFCGLRRPRLWDEKPQYLDIFDIKGEATAFVNKISLDNIKFIPYPNTDALTEYGLRIENNGENIGTIGLVRRDILAKFSIEEEVYILELNIGQLNRIRKKEIKFRSLPKYPSVIRDIAIIVDEDIQVEKISEEIRTACKNLLSKLLLFDIYKGDQIGAKKISCAYALEFMAEDHTMTQDEIDQIMSSIIKRVEKNLNATIRR